MAEESMDRFSNLPEELKLKIFSYLTPYELLARAAPVCVAWHEATRNPHLWKAVKIYGRRNAEIALEAVRWMTLLKRLHLEKVSRGADDILDAVTTHLESLSLCLVIIHRGQTLARLAAKCDKLREVDFTYVKYRNIHPLDAFAECEKLSKMSLSLFHKPSALNKPHAYPSLEEIMYDPEGPQEVEMQYLLKNAVKLRSLTTWWLKLPESFARVGRCSLVEELHLYCAFDMTDSCLLDSIGRLRSLRELSLVQADGLSRKALRRFFSTPDVVGGIKRLNLTLTPNVDDDCLAAIYKHCRSLTHFDIALCHKVTPQGILDVVRNCPGLQVLNTTCSELVDQHVLDINPNVNVHPEPVPKFRLSINISLMYWPKS